MPTVAQHYIQSRSLATRRTKGSNDLPAAPVVLMVSGGADSTALTVLACTSALDLEDGRGPARIARERLHVLHVNHHLRGDASDADEAFVRELCERYGLPLCVEHASLKPVASIIPGATPTTRTLNSPNSFAHERVKPTIANCSTLLIKKEKSG